jgi:hypothetical protein|tara:strand:+ start:1338 stop:1946 length:609 start_codon:yes stop_codon:yes gene_type:complete
MNKIRSVDLQKLGSFEGPSIFKKIDPRLRAKLLNFPEILERLEGCLEFCFQMGKETDKKLDVEESQNRRKFLRAALAEFASINDAAKIDAALLNVKFKKMLASNDPRIHVVRLLRHANVHLSATNLENTTTPAIWKEMEFDFQVHYALELRSSILNTEQAKCYTPEDLNKMIEWLEHEQMNWGIGHVILKTAELYAWEVLAP